jgi:energy-coupling factor transporter transmembrane protein EcfT
MSPEILPGTAIMPDLTPFGYRPGSSFAHRLDVRFKLGFIIALGIAGLNASPLPLSITTLIVVILLVDARIPLRSMLAELKTFLVLLSFVFIARCLSTPGEMWLRVGYLTISKQGLFVAGMVCWRLALVVMMGLLLVFATRTSQIRAGIEAFFTPIPLVPQRRMATMLGLILRFIPEILNQARENAAAQRARCIDNRRNPVTKLIRLALPLFRRVFLEAGELSMAMESRCFGENPTPCHFSSGWRDWLALVVVAFACGLSLFF